MQYLRGWRALRQDPDGTSKVMWACLLFLTMFCIPVLGQIVLTGWTGLMIRRAVSGQDAPLPRLDFDFDYLGKLLMVGFKPFLAQMLWSMPMILIVLIFYACMGFGMFAMVGGIAAGAQAGSEAGAGLGAIVGMLIMLAGWLVFMALIVLLSMLTIIVTLRVHITDDLNAAFKIRDIFKMTRTLMWELIAGGFVMYFLYMGIVFASAFTLYLLLPPGAVVMMIIMTYWQAELYRRYLEKGGEPLPIGPLVVEGGDVPHIGTGTEGPSAWTPPAQF